MMMKSKRSLFLTVVLVAGLLLAGCTPRPGAGTVAASAGSDALYLDLPAILIEFDAEGQATLLGMPAAELGSALGVDLSALSLDAETLAKFTAANVQHLQINNQPNVLRIYMNGTPLPAIIWNEEAMTALADTLTGMGTDASLLSSLTPLLPNLGVGLALKFPVASGQREIPLGTSGATIESAAALRAFDAAKAAQSNINLTLDYAADGTVAIGGIAPFMLNMIGLNPAALALPPDQIESITGQGIQSLGVKTVQNGLLLQLNGNALPYLQWSNANEITNLLTLAGAFAGPEMAGQLQQLQLIFNFPGLSATINFPES
ncbi:MAG: hypothetical protein KF832_26520 [Caldilineaceae bacterium]|nr:hypothetical protein [Caldilineaceae bacterium]